MSSVYKINQAEDKKLEGVVIRLKKKENSEVVRCFSEIKQLNRQLADMNLEKESMTHTFTQEELEQWDRRRRRQRRTIPLPKMAAVVTAAMAQQSTNLSLSPSKEDGNSAERDCNVSSPAAAEAHDNRGTDVSSIDKIHPYGYVPTDHVMDDDTWRVKSALSRRASTVTSSVAGSPINRSKSVLFKRQSFANGVTNSTNNGQRIPPTTDITDENLTTSTAVTTQQQQHNSASGRPVTRAKSCRAVMTSRQQSLPSIGDPGLAIWRRSSVRQRTPNMRRASTAYSLSSSVHAADYETDEDELSSSAPAKLQAMKQDIKIQDVNLMERIDDFLERVSPTEKPRKKRRTRTQIFYLRGFNT